MQIYPEGAELFHADTQTDRQTDLTKLTVTFRNLRRRLKTSGNSPGSRVGNKAEYEIRTS